MADEPQAPAVEAEVLVTTEETPTEETPAEPTLEELKASYAAPEGKYNKSVKAEQTLRTRAQTAENELTTFRTAAEQAEAERVANLSLTEQLAAAQGKTTAAEARALRAEAKVTDMRIEFDLGSAGFLAGLEGEDRSTQLDTLKALTGLSLVQQDGQFSIDLFSERFGGMKPAVVATENILTPAVIDLGGKTPPPTEQKASHKQELLDARKIGVEKGDRYGVMVIDAELSRLK